MDLIALGASASILITIMTVALAFHSGVAVRARVRNRLEAVLTGTASVVEGDAGAPLRGTPTVAAIFKSVVSGAWLERMGTKLERADSKLQPVDFMVIRFGLACMAFVAPYLFLGGVLGLLAALGAAVIGFQLPEMWINSRTEARSKKLEEQLPEAITLVSNSLKAGFGLLQALSLAADQMEHPISTELGQAIHEMNVGSHPDEALTALSERTGNYDLDLVVTAILVQRSVGGNLSEILDTVAATMRERVRIRAEVNTLTAQQRMTGYVLGLMPLGVGALFMLMSPEYIMVLFTEPVGKMMLGVGLVLEIIGIVIIRRILDIEV